MTRCADEEAAARSDSCAVWNVRQIALSASLSQPAVTTTFACGRLRSCLQGDQASSPSAADLARAVLGSNTLRRVNCGWASTSKCAAPLCHQRAQCALMCISECESASRRRSSSQLRHAWHTYIGCWPAVSLIHILRHGSPNSSLLHPPSPPRALPPRVARSVCPCLCRLPTPEPGLARRVPSPPLALSAARRDEEQRRSRTRRAGTDARRQTDTDLRRARHDRREQEP